MKLSWQWADDAMNLNSSSRRTIPLFVEQLCLEVDVAEVPDLFFIARARQKRYFLHFAVRGRDDAGFFDGGANRASPFPDDPGKLNGGWPHHTDEALNRRWNDGFLCRFFFFNRQGQLRRECERAVEALGVWPDGSAAWSFAELPAGRRFVNSAPPMLPTRFRWSVPLAIKEFLQLPVLDVWAQIQHQLADGQGETAFARSFARLDERERDASLGWENGTPRRMQHALRDALTAYGSWLDWESCELHVWSVGDLQIFGKKGASQTPQVEPSPQLRELVEAIWRFYSRFEPQRDAFQCEKEWIQERVLPLKVSVSRPSAHEQLEAALRWRDWLEQHHD